MSLSGNVIGNILDLVKSVLKLLGCDTQLEVYEEDTRTEKLELATQEDIACRASQEHVIVLPPSKPTLVCAGLPA